MASYKKTSKNLLIFETFNIFDLYSSTMFVSTKLIVICTVIAAIARLIKLFLKKLESSNETSGEIRHSLKSQIKKI